MPGNDGRTESDEYREKLLRESEENLQRLETKDSGIEVAISQ